MKRTANILILLGTLALIAAGCGGGDSAAPPVADPAPQTPATPTANCAAGDPACATPADATDVGTQGVQDAPTGQAPSKVSTLSELDGDGDDVFAPLKVIGTPEEEDNVFGLGTEGLEQCTSDTTAGSAPPPGDLSHLVGGFSDDACADEGLIPASPDLDEPAEPKVRYVEAVIAVNGKRYTVAKGGRFPKNDKMFTLDSLQADSVVIRLTAGEFTTGNDGITLRKGSTVVLANQSEGTEYEITLVKVRAEQDVTSTGNGMFIF